MVPTTVSNEVVITFDNDVHADLGEQLLYEIIARHSRKCFEDAVKAFVENSEADLKSALDCSKALLQMDPKCKTIRNLETHRAILEGYLGLSTILIGILNAKPIDSKSWEEVAAEWHEIKSLTSGYADSCDFMFWLVETIHDFRSGNRPKEFVVHLDTFPLARKECQITLDRNWFKEGRLVVFCEYIADKFPQPRTQTFKTDDIELISLYDQLFNHCGPLDFKLGLKSEPLAHDLELQSAFDDLIQAQLQVLEVFPWPFKFLRKSSPNFLIRRKSWTKVDRLVSDGGVVGDTQKFLLECYKDIEQMSPQARALLERLENVLKVLPRGTAPKISDPALIKSPKKTKNKHRTYEIIIEAATSVKVRSNTDAKSKPLKGKRTIVGLLALSQMDWQDGKCLFHHKEVVELIDPHIEVRQTWNKIKTAFQQELPGLRIDSIPGSSTVFGLKFNKQISDAVIKKHISKKSYPA